MAWGLAIGRKSPAEEVQKALAANKAKAIAELEQSEGWQHFLQAANDLIATYTPELSECTTDDMARIATRMAFVSGVKRCIGLMQQQKDILESQKAKQAQNN